MKIDSITLKGYGSYKNETAVKVPDGITGIVGVYDSNERKSNGSGKSTLISSMNYAFFGDGAEFDKMSEIINDQLPDNEEMFAKINFIQNGIPYEVERGIKRGSSYLNFKANGVPVHSDSGGSTHKNTIKNTTEEIVKVLGMDYEMFTTSVFFEQDGIDKFINVRPGVLRQYIDKVLGIEVWRLAEKDLNSKVNKTKEQIATFKEDIAGLEISINNMESQIVGKEQLSRDLESNIDLLKQKEDERNTLSNTQDFSERLSQTRNAVIEIGEEIDKLDKQIEETKINRDVLSSERNRIDLELKDLEVISVEEMDTAITNLRQEIEGIKSNEEDLKTTILNCTSRISELRTKHSLKCETREKFKAGTCAACEQEVTQEYVTARQSHYDKEIEEIRNEVVTAENAKDEAMKNASAFHEKRVAKEFELNELSTSKNDHILKLQKLRIEKSNLDTSIGEKQAAINRILQEVAEKTSKLQTNRTLLAELESQVVEGISDKINDLSAEITNINTSIAEYNRRIGALEQLEKNKQNLEKGLEDKKSGLNFLDECLYIYNVLVEAFREIPKRIFNKSIVAVQETANSIIHQVFPELSVLFYEDTAKKIAIKFDVAGKERRYKRLSGGQRVVVNIGIRLGFSHVIKKRANSNIDLIVLDEPFGALDEENRDLIKTVLANMQQWFKQILVISHVGGVEYFPRLIKVRYSPDRISYISN